METKMNEQILFWHLRKAAHKFFDLMRFEIVPLIPLVFLIKNKTSIYGNEGSRTFKTSTTMNLRSRSNKIQTQSFNSGRDRFFLDRYPN